MHNSHVPDTNQSYFQLACIQSTALGLSGIFVGGQLTPQYGAGSAILSVLIGNLVLWGIAYAIVSMSLATRENAVENVKKYVGVWPCIFASLILTIGFLSWSTKQNLLFVNTTGSLLKLGPFAKLNLGTVALIVTAFLSFRNIFLIKKICVISFPFLFLFALYHSIFNVGSYSEIFHSPWSISFLPTVAIIAQNLPGIVNLPTFFRHARSKDDALLALTLMTVFVSFFQIFGILVGITSPLDFFAKILTKDSVFFAQFAAVWFVVMSTLCVNLVNIYYASAGWESISNILKSISTKWNSKIKIFLGYIFIPRDENYTRAVGYICVINGLCAALLYQILQELKYVEFFESFADNNLASLGIVLMLAFLTKIFEKHRPKLLERTVSGVCWFIGGFIALYIQIKSQETTLALISGVSGSLLAYVSAILFETTYSAVTNLFFKKPERL